MTFVELKDRNEINKKTIVPEFLVGISGFDILDDIVYLSNGNVLDSVSDLIELIFEEDVAVDNIEAIKDWPWFDSVYRTVDGVDNTVITRDIVSLVEDFVGSACSLEFETVENLLKGIYAYQEDDYEVRIDEPNHIAIAYCPYYGRVKVLSDLNFVIYDADRLFFDSSFASIDLDMVDMQEVKALNETFCYCENLEYLDLSNVSEDVSNVDGFRYCPNLKKVKVGKKRVSIG